MRQHGILICASAVLVFALFGVARAGDLEDAAALQAQGRLEDAAVKYRAAAAADPASEAAAVGLSETLLALKRYDDAAEAAGAALEKSPQSVPLMLARIRALVAGADAAASKRSVDIVVRPEVLAKCAEARKCVDVLLEGDPQSVPGRILESRIALHEQGEDTPDIRRRMEGIVADAPQDPEANYQLGMLLFRAAGRNRSDKQLWAGAEKCFRATFASQPDNGRALFHAAACAAWQGRYDTYAADLEKAAELLPGEEEPLNALDSLHSKMAARRVPIFKRLHEKMPEEPNVAYYLASVLNLVGRVEDGMKLLDEQQAKYPDSAKVAFCKAKFLLDGGKDSEAVEATLKAASLCRSESDRPVYDAIDSMLVRTTQFDPEQRHAMWTALVTAFPGEVNGPNNAGIYFRDRARDYVKGRQWFLKALEIAPEDVMLLNDVALAYQVGSDIDEDKSEQYLRQAVAMAKKNGIARPDRSKGYSLAVDNLVKLLANQKRVTDLIALSHELADDPRAPSIVQLADSLRR